MPPTRKARSDTPAREEETPKSFGSASSPEDIEALRAKLAQARSQIGLRTQPLTTVRLFSRALVSFVGSTLTAALKSYLTWLLFVPLIGAWVGGRQFAPELFTPPVCGETEGSPVWQAEMMVKEVGWWMILGILSSVGFGTGLHSGLMFLFPHVMQVVTAAEGCGTTEGLISWYQHPCKLDCGTTSGPKDGSTVTFFRLFMLCTVQCMLWGIGTAAGELPPYLVSRAARLSGSKDSEFHEEVEEARKSNSIFNRMKIWTLDFTEKHGFIGVFLLASWPNAAFDMCGMACGYLLMPFWTFFIACCLGKGVVKVNLQAVFFINLFGANAFQILLVGLKRVDGAIEGVVGRDLELRALVARGRATLVRKFQQQSRFPPARLMPSGKTSLDVASVGEIYRDFDGSEAVAQRVFSSLDTDGDGRLILSELEQAASRTDGKVSLSSLDPGTGTSIFKMCWELFIVGLVLFFVCSVMVQMARGKQQELDEAELERLEKAKEKKK